MNIFPSNLPEQLDFNYIIDKVVEFCFGKNAKEKATIIKPKTSLFHIEKDLAETNEVLMSLLRNDSFIPNSYPEIDKELHLLTIENTVLTALQFHQIRNLIKLSNELIQYFSDKVDVYPFLVNKLSHLEKDKILGFKNKYENYNETNIIEPTSTLVDFLLNFVFKLIYNLSTYEKQSPIKNEIVFDCKMMNITNLNEALNSIEHRKQLWESGRETSKLFLEKHYANTDEILQHSV